jgi:hypothetical protein
LRGSSELHGWGDSNLYLRRHRDQLTLTVEHRAAPSLDPIPVQLLEQGTALALTTIDPSTRPQSKYHSLSLAPATRAPSPDPDSSAHLRAAVAPALSSSDLHPLPGPAGPLRPRTSPASEGRLLLRCSFCVGLSTSNHSFRRRQSFPAPTSYRTDGKRKRETDFVQ